MPDIIEQNPTMLDIRKAIRQAYPNRNHDWLAYQWQRAIDNVAQWYSTVTVNEGQPTEYNAVYMPAWHDIDMPADKAIALEILEHVFEIDLDGNTVKDGD